MKRIIIITFVFIVLMSVVPASARAKSFDDAIEDSAEGFFDLAQKVFERYRQFEEDVSLLAEVIYHENWWTDKDKLAAYYTGAVVMNRVHSPKWPNSIHDVLYQRRQYSTTQYFFTEELPDEVYDMARDILINGTPDVPYNVVYQATFKQGSGLWIPPINGEYFCYGEA